MSALRIHTKVVFEIYANEESLKDAIEILRSPALLRGTSCGCTIAGHCGASVAQNDCKPFCSLSIMH
jgi:ApbE superfamily uncharacterized protein (UPF0280 family)